MARAVWWAFALAAVAVASVSGARYGDYGEAKMPEYGSAIDYDGPRDAPDAPDAYHDHDHARDSVVPFDYKDDEDRGKAVRRSYFHHGDGKGNKRLKEGRDGWQHYVRKHKKYPDDDSQGSFDHYSSDDLVSNLKSNQRPSKHRPKHKPNEPHEDDLGEPHNQHLVRHSPNKKKDIGDIDSKHNIEATTDDFEDEKGIEFENDKIKVRNIHRDTTMRTARRKPRDRFVKSEPNFDQEDPILNIRERTDKEEFNRKDEAVRGNPMQPMQLSPRQTYRQNAAETRARAEPDSKVEKSKNYDYAEYYDMKRVKGIKDKLFKEKIQEVRRTTTTIFPFPTRSRPRSRPRAQHRVNDGIEGLRRLMEPPDYDSPPEAEEEEAGSSTPFRKTSLESEEISEPQKPFERSNRRKMLEPLLAISDEVPNRPPNRRIMLEPPTAISENLVHLMLGTSPEVSSEGPFERPDRPMLSEPLKSTTTTTPSTTPTTSKTETLFSEVPVLLPQQTTIELSLAEKSRLSILKKAQRKEMLKESATKKPPVLMQVTNKMQTLVMVEPPTSQQPWQQVSEVLEDTPGNIMKVKRLMRQKLVANAKSIHDLAENWNDVVCDYIDMSLLDEKEKSAASIRSISVIFIPLSFLAIQYYNKILLS